MSWNWRTGGEILSSIQILSAWFTPNCPWSPGQSWGKKRMLMMSVVKSDHVFKKMSEKVWKWKVSPGKKNSDVKTFHFPMSGWRKRYLHGSMWKLLDMVFQNYLTYPRKTDPRRNDACCEMFFLSYGRPSVKKSSVWEACRSLSFRLTIAFSFNLPSHRHFYMFSVWLSLYSFMINNKNL